MRNQVSRGSRRSGSANEQFERIRAVFQTVAIPAVTDQTLHIYLDYLKAHISCPCLLTGMESMGFFKWEERYSFGLGSEEEHQRLRQERGSFRDQYELLTLANAVTKGWGDIMVKVQRLPHRKRFTIPLSELQAVDQTSPQYQFLNDYSVWYVNWPS